MAHFIKLNISLNSRSRRTVRWPLRHVARPDNYRLRTPAIPPFHLHLLGYSTVSFWISTIIVIQTVPVTRVLHYVSNKYEVSTAFQLLSKSYTQDRQTDVQGSTLYGPHKVYFWLLGSIATMHTCSWCFSLQSYSSVYETAVCNVCCFGHVWMLIAQMWRTTCAR